MIHALSIVLSTLAQTGPVTHTSTGRGFRENANGELVEILAGQSAGCTATIEWVVVPNATGTGWVREVLFMACDVDPATTCEYCDILIHDEPNGDTVFLCGCAEAPQIAPGLLP